ncbi:MAG TPA: histidine phosphatase family protein [Candidatus Eisenbacteria bacterium]|nr:histidine phosphatase family protein [Candidatus Eisenbacteria bacterium]
MRIDLLRHGDAVREALDGDARRALSEEGVRSIRALAAQLRGLGPPPARAFSSPYLRARQTAELVLAGWGTADATALELLTELEPDADPVHAMRTVSGMAQDATHVLVVAHQPLLGRILVRLTGVERGLAPGTLARIEWSPGAGGGASLERVLPPE